MRQDIKEILIGEDELKKICARIGEDITRDYWDKDLMVIGILKGANVFMSDLIRQIDHPLDVDFMAVSSYGLATESSGVVKILKDLDLSIEGRDILIVEDIIDTGLTLKYLTENLWSRKPKSIKICTLLDKPARRKVDLPIDYKGVEVPDEFIVGYGIDYAEKYRNLPFVAVLKPSVYE
ncbi:MULTISPECIES: hypoxanthine phosphoribosyltransferase [unclassified Fusibacter]|uniref:hypoxanthine phosphoribosyltransferase n=1 Tax=unclassified Fusibacter TaxID=2624464 RepID=UPI001011B5F7|nr:MULTISPECIES: hypoxanthine phosphoribosyltransferase [unclassified Fusibacter]MCK8058254.1 hypoxanthine phosphoribosyltransferase [Fusibacter sp. A2]NPE20837.1 hypoxanthine phosphoribosyltransferase [Fusibacter sp. A1]RXV63042.1 hypoxanthine phosphoribosyltransferase [Fusibacter sp. A1]